MRPHEDLIGPRPSKEHVWCDECCRWEHVSRMNRTRLRPRGWSRVLSAISRVFCRIAGWFDDRAERAFIRDNRKRGLLVEIPEAK
jgi:hypothetical protein